MVERAATSPSVFRRILVAVFVADVIVTASVLLLLDDAFYGALAKGRVVMGVFVLFPIVLWLAIGIPLAVIGAVRDWRGIRDTGSQ